jgi:osmotically-inducible protein OsmY
MLSFTKSQQIAVLSCAGAFLLGSPLQASDLDKRIETAAKHSHNFKTYLKDDNIKVQSKDGMVTLSGTVSRDYHKFLAQETVSELPGVKSVLNQLTVVGEQPTDNSDAWITMKVKTALTFHKHVSASDTEVNTQNGVVTLSGQTNTEAMKQLTGEYAKDVEGVTEVRNELTVRKSAKVHPTLGEKVDDASITAQIKTTLLFRKSTHALATKVSTKDGVVSLRGEARNVAEKDLVTKLAEDINGVKQVHNRMTVK